MYKIIIGLLVFYNTITAQIRVDIEPPKPGTGIPIPKSKYEKNINNPVYPYHCLSQRPSFIGNQHDESNRRDINKYMIQYLRDKNIVLNTSIGAKVILGKNRRVLDVYIYDCENKKLESIIKKIILNMPRWEQAGMYNGKPVRVNCGVWLDIKKIHEYQ